MVVDLDLRSGQLTYEQVRATIRISGLGRNTETSEIADTHSTPAGGISDSQFYVLLNYFSSSSRGPKTTQRALHN